MKNYLFILFGVLFLSQTTIAQSSLKRLKQKHRFHYLQANLHIGSVNGERLDASSHGPKNRLVYQYLAKNQRLMQKGYVRTVSLSSFRSRVSMDYIGSMRGPNASSYQLKLQNVGLNFATKWDRTSIFVGYSNIRLGHNPKIDPVTSFIANSLNLDIGFTQDLGVSFKTAISQKYDFEAAVYSGGLLKQPLLTYTPGPDEEGQSSRSVDFIDPNYNGSWLSTFRVGSSLFRHVEYGFVGMAGKIGEGANERYVTRAGADAVIKIGEKLKFNNQVVGGVSAYHTETNSFDLTLQSNLEVYIRGMFMFSTSNATLFVLPENEGKNKTKGIVVNSLSYVISPHTRVRLNQFYEYGSLLTSDNSGWTFQLVTGIGKR